MGSLNVLPLKRRVGQYIAMHAMLTARDFFHTYFFPSGPLTYIFFQNLSWFFPVLAVANTGSCVGPQNKIGHPAGCRFLCWVSMEYKLAQKTWLVAPQWGAADAEIKVPSNENTELKHSPFKAWSRSVYSRTCYAYCQGFLPCLFLPFRSIHLHFFPKPLLIFSCDGCG